MTSAHFCALPHPHPLHTNPIEDVWKFSSLYPQVQVMSSEQKPKFFAFESKGARTHGQIDSARAEKSTRFKVYS